MKKKVYYIYKDKKYESVEELLPNMSNDDLLDLREIIVDKFVEEMMKDDEERKILKKYYITKAIMSGALIVASIFIDNSPIKFGFIGAGVGLWLYFPSRNKENKIIENDINEVLSILDKYRETVRGKVFFIGTIILELSALGIFKYINFFVDSLI